MHPILPTLVAVLIAMSDLGAWYLWRYGASPDVSIHAPSVWTLIGISLVFANGIGYVIRRWFHWNFPLVFAIVSTLLVVASSFLRY